MICPRVPSEKSLGDAGWLHRPSGEMFAPPVPALPVQEESNIDWEAGVTKCEQAMAPHQWEFMANDLQLPQDSLRAFRMGWSQAKGAYTFPMHDASGKVIGVRLRYPNGRKLSVKGSRSGLFMHGADMSRGLLLVAEGPTDAAALHSLGYNVVGRPSCNGGTKYLYELVNWKHQIVLIPDKDKPGIDGAESVAKMLKVKTKQVKIVEPRGVCTDAKEWVVGGLRREQLDILIGQASNV